jgi:hypothetical protein
MKRIFWPSLLILFAGWAFPVQAYQVYITQQNVLIRPGPDLRSGSLVRLSHVQLPLQNLSYASDGELWCQIRLQNKQSGWVQARYLDPVLSKNLPLRLADIPGPLLFSYAQRQISYANLADPGFKRALQKNLILLEISSVKQRWDYLRSRHDFLDVSRRVGIGIDKREFQTLEQEMKSLEQLFQRLISQVI